MNTSEILKDIRTKHDLSQDEMAQKLFVTRQAVSRWEKGETIPNTETLKTISRLFDISINTLLGSPRKLICQCCGMPLDDDGSISREIDGSFNENYCKWCYTGGEFTYKTLEDILNFLTEHMSGENFPPEQAREYFESIIPKLNHWNK